jgi:hypothetical protein
VVIAFITELSVVTKIKIPCSTLILLDDRSTGWVIRGTFGGRRTTRCGCNASVYDFFGVKISLKALGRAGHRVSTACG